MNKIDRIITQIQQTLRNNHVNFDDLIEELTQYQTYTDRAMGKPFPIEMHIRAMIYAQLSNQRQWGPIAENLSRIDKIFRQYNPAKLKKADPVELRKALHDINCGNRADFQQLQYLARNIKQLEQIEREYGSLDAFVLSKDPITISELLSDMDSPYKLFQVGLTLALEYLRNVGIQAIKPDVHLLRIAGLDRLELIDIATNPKEAARRLMEIAVDSTYSAVEIDLTIWMLGARQYGSICGKIPKCNLCSVMECKQKAN